MYPTLCCCSTPNCWVDPCLVRVVNELLADFTLSGRLKTNFCWLVADAATFPELTFSGGLKINCLLLDVENVDDKLILPAIGAGELDCDPRPKLKDGMVETLKGKNRLTFSFSPSASGQINQNILGPKRRR